METRKLQILRRTVQILVVLTLVLIPSLARYNNYLAARELDQAMEGWSGTLPGEILKSIDVIVTQLPGTLDEDGERDRDAVLEKTQSAMKGGSWSVSIGPVSMTDPLAVAESAAASKRVPWVLVVGLVIPLVVTILFGKVFCSWICPMGFLLELNDWFREKVLRFLEIRPRNVRISRSIKYLLLGVGLVMTALLSVPVLGTIYPPAMVSREIHDFVFGLFDHAEAGKPGFWIGGLTWMSLVILGIIVFEMFISRRWWCRYVCPGGALYALLGKKRAVRMELVAENCTKCADCVPVCPMALNPMKNRFGIDCDNCGVCLSHCHDDALKFVLRLHDRDNEDEE